MNKAAEIAPHPWMTAPPTVTVLDALSANGAPARFVGGCVRDAVAGRPVKDIDIATPETPEEVMALLARAGVKTVPTGIDHGTVTAVTGGAHFEVTTLRRDVETYGRHAKVAFTDAWEEDAARRDFTMNALYADADGAIYDPTGGLADLKAGRVRFVGDAETRIREDVLRLLRYFRFYADYGTPPPDADALAACRKLAPQIPTLSVERVWAELARLLVSPRSAATIELMRDQDVLPHVLPEAGDLSAIAALVDVEAALGVAPTPARRLAALVDLDAAGMEALGRRLKMSNADIDRLAAIADARGEVTPALDARGRRRALYRLGADLYRDLALLGAAAGTPGEWQTVHAAADGWERPPFPLVGGDVLALGIPKGPRVGELLRAAESWWIDQDFKPRRDACLKKLRALAEE